MSILKTLLISIMVTCALESFGQSSFDTTRLIQTKTVTGKISPKSVVYGDGKIYAQNMMYRHSVTVYDTLGSLLKTIPDTVTLSQFGIDNKTGVFKGAPVEGSITPDGKYYWISNYQMYGQGFDNAGCDACSDSTYDHSYLYAINTNTLAVDHVAEVGSVPKFLAISSDNKYLIVSNWSSADISVVNPQNGSLIKTIQVGKHPRGLAFNQNNTKVYVALMGDDAIAEVEIDSWEVSVHKDAGDAPRHILYADSCLYYSVNNENSVTKWDLRNDSKESAKVGTAPRSMAFSIDTAYAYVVNYSSSSLSKIKLKDMSVVQTIPTKSKPIGVTVTAQTNKVWVACYGGSLICYEEREKPSIEESNFYMIVGSFSSEKNALNFSDELTRKGYPASILSSADGKYRVSVFQSNDYSEMVQNQSKYRVIVENPWILRHR
ncbi:SPOR domain-containing protein [Aureibacter tunicatorum]|uniref:YVTN family beta-propeller protein n=1 Tax=Aureibacter tunicatorum TaxID=866807 RepID=A0AAE3XS67_9BACT|nr:SPOR domain-containing protein [Aureibacter tunicatorum]MDR6241118.1 YVTN family beta-propeller protein [Aureibacter tunicatorum]BDD03896.1 hypothetical protein AUTU_13790 [Aureibacter tunicatorum]